MSSGSGTTPTDAKRKQPQRGKRSEPIDYATMAGFRRVKSQRERSTPIRASPLLAAPGACSSFSSEVVNETINAISEQMSPQVLEDLNSGLAQQTNPIGLSALSDPVLGTGQGAEPEQETKPTEAPAQTSDQTHAPGVSGLGPALQINSSLLDGMLVEHGGALVIPFDVTSYPFWNNERELEDQLYWETWAANHGGTPGGVSGEAPSQTRTPCENQSQPPDHSSGSSSQR